MEGYQTQDIDWRTATVADVAGLNPEDINAKFADDWTLLREKGWTSLHFAACYNKDPKVIRALIKKGFKLEEKDSLGRTPLHIAAGFNKPKIDSSDMADSIGAYKKSDTLLAFINTKAKLEAKDKNGWTPLHFAARHNILHVVRTLIDAKADPTAKTTDGETPLHFAAGYNSNAAMRVFFHTNADKDAKDKRGWRPIHYAARYRKGRYAAQNDYYTISDLVSAGCNPSARTDDTWESARELLEKHNKELLKEIQYMRSDIYWKLQ